MSSAQKPSLGRVVLVLVEPTTNNGSDTAPATVTRVWSEQQDGSWLVNVKVALDSVSDRWLTSIPLFGTEDDARAYTGPNAAFWPPRV